MIEASAMAGSENELIDMEKEDIRTLNIMRSASTMQIAEVDQLQAPDEILQNSLGVLPDSVLSRHLPSLEADLALLGSSFCNLAGT